VTTIETDAPVEDAVLVLPRGFRAAGVHCGLKRRRPDLALFASDGPAAAAGMFTQNATRAACVTLCERKLVSPVTQAIVINSGNANACTGPDGFTTAQAVTQGVADALGIDDSLVLGASTGVIGRPLPAAKLVAAAPSLVAALGDDAMPAARAIMTTDAFPKTASARIDYEDGTVSIVGVAKGAGMIHPDMATMIAVLLTDAAVPPELLRSTLRRAVGSTFNCISTDGDTSTNDSVFLLANGASGCAPLDDVDEPRCSRFARALASVAERLALDIVRDGEGAEHVIQVTVRGARSDEDARKVANAVMTSPLVKTAFHGCELNWGRVSAAAGRSGAEVDPDRLSIAIGGVEIVRNGVGVPEHYPLVEPMLREPGIRLAIGLGLGNGVHRGWTNDLGTAYVRLNSGYLT